MMIILLAAQLLIGNANASYYHRFWTGYKKTEVSDKKFVKDLNSIFFQKTIESGSGKGLIAYQPYLLHRNKDFPDEIALVTYASEEKYQEIRVTPEGKAYAELHWDYFDRNKSKSNVAMPYAGTLEVDQAYELHPDFKNEQTASTSVYFYVLRSPGRLATLQKDFELLKKDSHVLNSVLVVKQGYAIEYRMMDTPSGKPNELKSIRVSDPQPLLKEGQGANFQF